MPTSADMLNGSELENFLWISFNLSSHVWLMTGAGANPTRQKMYEKGRGQPYFQ